MIDNSDYFFCNVEQTQDKVEFLGSLKNLADRIKQQVYVLSGPLTDHKYTYNDKSLMIVLSSKKKIAFVSSKDKDEDFEDTCDEIIEDIGAISYKYEYKNVLGRPKKWREKLTFITSLKEIGNNVDTWFKEDIRLESSSYNRALDLIISLFIGSINDVSNITVEEPDNLLDKVKKKIQLFDGQQTRFIYEELDAGGKRVSMQGLSGTGKTELLLHKLKELYIKDTDATFAFTCYNKILARKLKSRIPQFFNIMKVEQQIDWHRLMCVRSWGSNAEPESGIYRYICHWYNIPFLSYRQCDSFKKACETACQQIKDKTDDKKRPFTYMFIDESQDFDESFFALCELATEKKLYIAGDIFQSIFEERKKNEVRPNFLLSKCYRTDPKTLMFAHALGMGLFEEKKLWWLDKQQWEDCGYSVEESDGCYTLRREPLRRFEDVDPDFVSIKIRACHNILRGVIDVIKEIKKEYPTVIPDDIAVIFLDNSDSIYQAINVLSFQIQKELGYPCNIGYETKRTEKGSILISNRNNAKGLEFPFVVCVTRGINDAPQYRNTLYTMLTRSFIRSYLLLPKENNGLTDNILEGGRQIMKDHRMVVTVPSEEEQKKIRAAWAKGAKKAMSLEERIIKVCSKLGINDESSRDKIRKAMSSVRTGIPEEELQQLVYMYYNNLDEN